MQTWHFKIIALLVIILGELLMIWQQMLLAKSAKQHNLTYSIGIPIIIWSVLGVALVLAGYYVGYSAYKNIWIVSVLSVGSVLIAEVLLSITIFGEIPTIGAWIGMACGIIGIAASLLF